MKIKCSLCNSSGFVKDSHNVLRSCPVCSGNHAIEVQAQPASNIVKEVLSNEKVKMTAAERSAKMKAVWEKRKHNEKDR